ncbi:hypothetical protein [Shimia ponticola]|uniref:hypothetical protein n=1 Tax=Shimia ponticola TaxID=2582893 RepID=UPI0011BFCA56|nr:hypothetical protein [Shimia ponticola]
MKRLKPRSSLSQKPPVKTLLSASGVALPGLQLTLRCLPPIAVSLRDIGRSQPKKQMVHLSGMTRHKCSARDLNHG